MSKLEKCFKGSFCAAVIISARNVHAGSQHFDVHYMQDLYLYLQDQKFSRDSEERDPSRGKSGRRHKTILTATSDCNEQLKCDSDTSNVIKRQ